MAATWVRLGVGLGIAHPNPNTRILTLTSWMAATGMGRYSAFSGGGSFLSSPWISPTWVQAKARVRVRVRVKVRVKVGVGVRGCVCAWEP